MFAIRRFSVWHLYTYVHTFESDIVQQRVVSRNLGRVQIIWFRDYYQIVRTCLHWHNLLVLRCMCVCMECKRQSFCFRQFIGVLRNWHNLYRQPANEATLTRTWWWYSATRKRLYLCWANFRSWQSHKMWRRRSTTSIRTPPDRPRENAIYVSVALGSAILTYIIIEVADIGCGKCYIING